MEIKMTEENQHAGKDRFIVRFHSAGQRASLKERAQANMRTLNAELLFLIEAGIRTIDGQQGQDIKK